MAETIGDRTFATFELGDRPDLLAHGVIRTIAEDLSVDLGTGTALAAYGRLARRLGSGKEPELERVWTPERAAELVVASGIQTPLDRSIWTPEIATPEEAIVLITGDVPGWQGRAADLAVKHSQRFGEALVLTGNRIMNSEADRRLPVVRAMRAEDPDGQYPTESAYAAEFVVPRLRGADYEVTHLQYDTASGDEIAAGFVSGFPELLSPEEALVCAHVASAGVQFALSVRAAARTVDGRFDDDRYNPQMYVLTHQLPVARTEAEVQDPAHFQSPYVVLGQLAITARMLAAAHAELAAA